MNITQEEFKSLPLKEMDGTLLAFAIIDSVPNEHKAVINDACRLAAFLHRGQTRNDRGIMPKDHYITHPMRNTLRLIRWGITNIDILVASLLHDTVEDCRLEILRMAGITSTGNYDQDVELCLNVMSERFNANVARILRGVTNPEMDKDLTREAKHVIYREHVLSAVDGDMEIFLVKIADLMDNAGSLVHQALKNPQRNSVLASKYLPLVDPLLRIAGELNELPHSASTRIIVQLNNLSERLPGLILSEQH